MSHRFGFSIIGNVVYLLNENIFNFLFPAELCIFNKEKKGEELDEFRDKMKRAGKPKNILVIGEQGVGKSSFINSCITSIMGKYTNKAQSGKKGNDTPHVTIKLKRYVPVPLCGNIVEVALRSI